MLGFGAIAESPIAALPDTMWATFLGTVTWTAVSSDDFRLYAATAPYVSRLADTPPGQPFAETLLQLPRFDRSIITSTGFDGLQLAFGSTGLINAEGTYDVYHRGYAVDGREVVYRVGLPDAPYSEHFEVARLIATSIEVDGQTLVIGHRDRSFLLEVPTQPNKYLGIGDLEGGAELEGKPKPLWFGNPRGVAPVPLIAAELVLQVNDGAVSAITTVYDKAYPLTFSADYATPALLRAATIAAGSYATCLAFGLIRTGAPYAQITCNVVTDYQTTGAIMRRIIALTGCIDDPGDLDLESFVNLELIQPAPVDYGLDAASSETVAQTFDRLMRGIGGACGFTRLGKLQAQVFTAPAGTPAAEYEDRHIIGELDVEQLPGAFDPPPHRVRVAYARNWTVIEDPYPGAVDLDPEGTAAMKQPYKVAATGDSASAAILEDHLLSQEPAIVESFFQDQEDALAEAERLLSLANSDYRLYRAELKAPPFTLDTCQTVRLTLDRFGFADGRLLRIASISDIPETDRIELRIYG